MIFSQTMAAFSLTPQHPYYVGSFGRLDDIISFDSQKIQQECDLVEIRLDLLLQQGWQPGQTPWANLKHAGTPLLFTARCHSEGGAGQLSNHDRENLLLQVVDDASLIDIELINARDMPTLRQHCQQTQLPWIASFHDFTRLPETPSLVEKTTDSQQLGASAFKVAATLLDKDDVRRLADFQRNWDQYPVSSMGMGPHALESRICCGLAGSVLNYGFLGHSATAPGQCGVIDLREQMSQRRQMTEQ